MKINYLQLRIKKLTLFKNFFLKLLKKLFYICSINLKKMREKILIAIAKTKPSTYKSYLLDNLDRLNDIDFILNEMKKANMFEMTYLLKILKTIKRNEKNQI